MATVFAAEDRPALTPDRDAYGRLMRDHERGLATAEIVERDDGWVGVSRGAAMYFAPFEAWEPHQRRLLRLCRGRVLDVGCGAGRACLALQARGHAVVGIDVSPLAVAVSRRRGVADARVLAATQTSRRLGAFDSVLLLGNNLGLLGGLRRARWLLARWHGMTTPEARIVGETLDPYATADPAHRSYHRRNRRRGRLGGQLRIRVRYGRWRTPWFDYLMLSRAEVARIVSGTGWRVEQFVPGPGPRYGVVLEKSE